MNTTTKSKFTSSQLALMFVCGFGIGYALFKMIKTGFHDDPMILLCACATAIAGMSWRALSKK